MRALLRFLFRGKRSLATVPLLLLLVGAGFLALRWRWYRGYSRGTRTGIVQKVSVKGPPYCKYASVELLLQSPSPQQFGLGERWEVTLDEHGDGNPLLLRLQQAERDGQRVTVHYRQDLDNKGKFWLMCDMPQYYVESIE